VQANRQRFDFLFKYELIFPEGPPMMSVKENIRYFQENWSGGKGWANRP